MCGKGFNEDGTCRICYVDETYYGGECQKCSELITDCERCSSPDTCTKCKDPTAKIVNGNCVCEEGLRTHCLSYEVKVDGVCEKCSKYI